MIVKSYLSRTHRDSRSTGCATSALISDVARADELPRRVMEQSLEEFIANVAQTMEDQDDAKADQRRQRHDRRDRDFARHHR